MIITSVGEDHTTKRSVADIIEDVRETVDSISFAGNFRSTRVQSKLKQLDERLKTLLGRSRRRFIFLHRPIPMHTLAIPSGASIIILPDEGTFMSPIVEFIEAEVLDETFLVDFVALMLHPEVRGKSRMGGLSWIRS